MSAPRSLSFTADQVRRLDNDRFLCALFAPEARREALFALYAFNLEVAMIPEAVTEPMLGLIRLQWWREAIRNVYSGTPPRHDLVAALADAVQRFGLSHTHFERLLEAREHDLDERPPKDMDALLAYVEGTSASLTALALEILCAGEGGGGRPAADGPGEAAMAASRHVGIAWALAGLLRAVDFHACAQRLYLPQALLDQAGVGADEVFARRPSPGLARVATAVADAARENLDAARRLRPLVPRRAHPALLPAVLAEAYLRRLARARYDVFDPRLSIAKPVRVLRLVAASVRGRY